MLQEYNRSTRPVICLHQLPPEESHMSAPKGMVTLLIGLSLTISAGRTACAQAIAVQQPVVQQFGVQSAVSVPDRGAALLGSVGSAAEFRRQAGPLPMSTAIGRQIAHAGVSVHVTIHDFAAMDAAVLSAAAQMDGRVARNAPPTGMAARARNQLLRQHRQNPPPR